MTTPSISYRDTAIKRFNSLLDQQPDFWKAANAFDTMIDFLEFCSIDPKGDAAKAADWVINLSYYDPDQTWFDDFGWWTIGTGRAAQKTSVFDEDDRQRLAGKMSDCWSRFKDNAPFVWARKPTGEFNNCTPAVPGGVWNGYWEGTDAKWQGPKDGDPNSGTLLGIQNTVTNAVHLLSAQVAKDDAADKREFAFLDTWLNMESGHGPYNYKFPLLWELSKTQALVRERATHYQGRPAPGFQLDWAWTGDQGLMIGALVAQAMRTDTPPGKRTQLLEQAVQILEGVQLKLVEKGILNYWTLTGQPPSSSSTDPKANYDDYSTGNGVFWRYVLRVWNANYLRPTLGTAAFKKILQTNAEQAMKDARSWPNGYKPSQDWVTLTNDLAVLVAACKMPA
jgi:hypothetical protein